MAEINPLIQHFLHQTLHDQKETSKIGLLSKDSHLQEIKDKNKKRQAVERIVCLDGDFVSLSPVLVKILIQKSNYFKNLWEGEFKYPTETMIQYTSTDFKLLINYCEKNKECPSLEDAQRIIELAHYFELKDLQETCEKVISAGMQDDTLVNSFSSQAEYFANIQNL